MIALLPAQIPDVTETTETPESVGDELLSVSSALGWVAIDGGAVIEFNAEQNGSLVSRYKFARMGLYNNYISWDNPTKIAFIPGNRSIHH